MFFIQHTHQRRARIFLSSVQLRLRHFNILFLCCLGLWAQPGFSQVNQSSSSSSAASKVQDEDVKEVVVVGSRIRRTTFDSPSPVSVITREEVTAAGFNSTADLLQSNAITSGGSQINNAYGGFVTDGGPGANTVSLRGLGASRTLVLINGRRLSPAGTRGAVGSVDLNVLPNAMIERVEVLKDGASSVYGSDAIGGVVNVITMDKLDGFAVEAEYNQPTEGDGEDARFSISGGLSDDRWRLSGSLDIYDRADLTLGDRGWTRCAPDGLRDAETGETLDYIDPKTNKPKCFTITGTGTHGVTINTIGTQSVTAANWSTLGLNGPVVGAPGSTGTTFTRFRPNAAVTTGLVGFEGVGGSANSLNVRDTFDPRMLDENIITPERIYTAFLQGQYDLQALGDAKLYVEFLGSRRESSQTSFRQLSADYRYGSPSIPSNLAFAKFGPDQGTSDGNPVGVRAFIGFGNDHSEQTVDFLKPTLGIKGDLSFLPDWKYHIYASYSRSDGEYVTESFLTDKITYASDAITAPGGLDSALVHDGLTCQINLTNPEEKCVPFPLLTAGVIGGNLPKAFRDYIFRDVVGHTKYNETLISATFDGPLFELPAGKVQGVLGLEHRSARIDDRPGEDSINDNLYNLSSATPTRGSDKVSELYTEVEVPILANISWAKELTLNGSYRYTDYKSYGAEDTYKLGLVYRPTSWLSLRGTKGTSFRAPALFEQFQGATSGFLSSASDPCNNFGAPDVNPVVAANCESELPGQGDEFQATSGIQAYNQGGAAAGLEAETSDNVTYGIILEPSLGDYGQLSLALDYFDIQINNGVAQAGAENILTLCYNDPDFRKGGGFCRLTARDPATAQLTVNDVFTNLSTQVSRGIDFTGRYEQGLGEGELVINLSTTHYLSQGSKLFKDDPMDEFNGTIMWPEWSGSADVSYTLNNWRLTYGVEWVGAMDSYKIMEEDPATSDLDLRTSDYYKHRISLRYATESWEATLGVRNIFNEEPPSISALAYDRMGNAPLYSAYDYVGRQVFLNVQFHY